jgi:hypothetical protein
MRSGRCGDREKKRGAGVTRLMTHVEIVSIIALLQGIYYIGLTFLALTILALFKLRRT